MKEHRFYFEGNLVRVYEMKDGNIQFNLEDVCNALNMTKEEASEFIKDMPNEIGSLSVNDSDEGIN